MHLITFDVDDTLVFSGGADDAGFIQAVTDVLGHVDFERNWDTYAKATDPGIAEAILKANLHRAPTVAELKAVEDAYLRNLQHARRANPECFTSSRGAKELLQTLRQCSDFAVAFATGAWHSCASYKLRAAGISPEGIPMATANDHDSKKGIVLAAHKKAQAHYGVDSFLSSTHVGDRPSDREAAAISGSKFIAFLRNDQAALGFADAEASLITSDFCCQETFLRIFRA